MSKMAKWDVGCVFLLPLLDGRCALGQVVGREPEVLNSATVALFGKAVAGDILSPELDPGQAISVVFSTRDHLDSGRWRVVGQAEVTIDRKWFPSEAARADGFIGAKVYGSRNVEALANAYFGLEVWDRWADPEYLDKMLISRAMKPANVKLKNRSG